MSKEREKRYRDFATVVYPDSDNTPDDWIERLEAKHVGCLISPLHDKDVNPDGTSKKPHFHVTLLTESPKPKQWAIDIFNEIGGVGCELVNSRRGMTRYLTHMDNPDKYQYSQDDVRILGGVDYFDIIRLASDKYALLMEIIDLILEKRYTNIIDIYRYAREFGLYDWQRVILDNTFIINSYCKSVRDRKIDVSSKYLKQEQK